VAAVHFYSASIRRLFGALAKFQTFKGLLFIFKTNFLVFNIQGRSFKANAELKASKGSGPQKTVFH